MSDQNNNNSDGEKAMKPLTELFNHANDLPKCDAIKILSDHLEGSWNNLTEDDLDLTILQGGFVNRLFICENKKVTDGSEPRKVILRLMGGKLLDKYAADSIMTTHGEVVESLNYVLMSQANLGPKIYGIFSGGRIEEYIESRIISNADLADDQITAAFARQLARIHNMRPPIVKRAKDMFGIIKKIREDNLPEFIIKMKETPVPTGLEEAAKLWFDFDMYQYLDWMNEVFPTIKTRVVFSHNDMNRANCIVRQGPGTELLSPVEKVILIDYEFCCFGWRGCDIGQHFYNRTLDVTKMAGKDLSAGDVDYHSGLKYPTEEERRYFIEQYLDEVSKLGTYQLDSDIDSVETILIEAEYFGILWNLFLCMWIVRDHGKWANSGFGGLGQMFGFMGDYCKNMNERKVRFLELKKKYPKN